MSYLWQCEAQLAAGLIPAKRFFRKALKHQGQAPWENYDLASINLTVPNFVLAPVVE